MIQAIAASALAGGIVSAILWVALWTVAFPGVWPGYGVLTVPFFWVGVIGGPILLFLGRK